MFIWMDDVWAGFYYCCDLYELIGCVTKAGPHIASVPPEK